MKRLWLGAVDIFSIGNGKIYVHGEGKDGEIFAEDSVEVRHNPESSEWIIADKYAFEMIEESVIIYNHLGVYGRWFIIFKESGKSPLRVTTLDMEACKALSLSFLIDEGGNEVSVGFDKNNIETVLDNNHYFDISVNGKKGLLIYTTGAAGLRAFLEEMDKSDIDDRYD